MNKAMILTAALIFTPALCEAQQGEKAGGPTSRAAGESTRAAGESGEISTLLKRLSQSGLKDRFATAIERVKGACADDIAELCGPVTPGEGQIVACIKENADGLSPRCRFTLFRAARNIREAIADIADDCESGLKEQCAGAEKIGDCAEQKSAAISPACHAVVLALRHRAQETQETPGLKGKTVLSSDGQDVGRIVEATRGTDGKIESAQIATGRALGLGEKVIPIGADTLQEQGGQIRLRLSSAQLRALHETRQ
jgi:Cysteine rich repeat